ncbi:MAG TPA: helix-turn-helix domain-containing protein [Acidimicrobiia bacterium]|nr:helix-turn-helix domain-containing protein [Acidimicrobiia bacterium]
MDPQRLGIGDLAAIGALTDSTRRELYEFVVTSARAVGRDEAADAVGIPRQTAAYHLDRLAEEGLVEVEFLRRSGRTGPGAGRPAKLYKRSERDHEISLPPRRYALAARILLEAVSSNRVALSDLAEVANRVGRELASEGLGRALQVTGYEPVEEEGEIRFRNCPFHALKEQDQETVCHMNLGLVEGMLEAAPDGRHAHLEPSDSYCCVRIRP